VTRGQPRGYEPRYSPRERVCHRCHALRCQAGNPGGTVPTNQIDYNSERGSAQLAPLRRGFRSAGSCSAYTVLQDTPSKEKLAIGGVGGVVRAVFEQTAELLKRTAFRRMRTCSQVEGGIRCRDPTAIFSLQKASVQKRGACGQPAGEWKQFAPPALAIAAAGQ